MTAVHTIRGFTMVEAMIAATILVVVIAITFEGMAASSKQQALGETTDELSEDARAIIRQMNNDLAASGWHFADRLNADVTTPDVGESSEQFLVYDPSMGGWNHNGLYQGTNGVAQDFTADRTRHYYPFISEQATPDGNAADEASRGLGTGATTSFPNRTSWKYTWRNPSMRWVGALPSALPGRPWTSTTDSGDANRIDLAAGSDEDLASFHARSRELIFLRTTVAGWKSDPSQMDSPMIGFRGTAAQWRSAAATAAAMPETEADRTERAVIEVLHTSGFMPDPSQPELRTYRTDANNNPLTIYGALLEAGLIESQANGNLLVRPKWETMSLRTVTTNGVTTAVTPSVNGMPSNFRAYMYAVIPSPRGLGRLVRAHSVVFGLPEAEVNRGEGSGLGNWISYDSAANKAMVIDTILSDNVVRIVFTTRRHDVARQVNQISVRLWMAKQVSGPAGQDPVIYRVIETDLYMGTRAGSNDVYYDGEALGPAVPFVP